jgi:hypothetical protein
VEPEKDPSDVFAQAGTKNDRMIDRGNGSPIEVVHTLAHENTIPTKRGTLGRTAEMAVEVRGRIAHVAAVTMPYRME